MNSSQPQPHSHHPHAQSQSHSLSHAHPHHSHYPSLPTAAAFEPQFKPDYFTISGPSDDEFDEDQHSETNEETLDVDKEVSLIADDGQSLDFISNSSLSPPFPAASYSASGSASGSGSSSVAASPISFGRNSRISSLVDTESERVGPFQLGPVLGRGCTGTVRLAVHRRSGFQVAFKIIDKKYLNSEPKLWKKVKREIAILKLIEHPHVLKLFDVLETEKNLYLILEHVKGGELFDHIVSRGRLGRDESLRIIAQIVSGLNHCHDHSICHRDLKPENLLLTDSGSIKIADFGMAQLMKKDGKLRTSCGSPHYVSPEVALGHAYDARFTDCWSIGVILFALITGSLPFDHENIPTLLHLVTRGEYKTPSHVPRDIADLISKMLTVDPQKRIRLADICSHPCFAGTDYFGANSATSPIKIPPVIRQHSAPPVGEHNHSNEAAVRDSNEIYSNRNDERNRKSRKIEKNTEISSTGIPRETHWNSDSDSDSIDESVLNDLESLGLSWGSKEELRQKVKSKSLTKDHKEDSGLERTFYKLLKQRRTSRLEQLAVLSPKAPSRVASRTRIGMADSPFASPVVQPFQLERGHSEGSTGSGTGSGMITPPHAKTRSEPESTSNSPPPDISMLSNQLFPLTLPPAATRETSAPSPSVSLFSPRHTSGAIAEFQPPNNSAGQNSSSNSKFNVPFLQVDLFNSPGPTSAPTRIESDSVLLGEPQNNTKFGPISIEFDFPPVPVENIPNYAEQRSESMKPKGNAGNQSKSAASYYRSILSCDSPAASSQPTTRSSSPMIPPIGHHDIERINSPAPSTDPASPMSNNSPIRSDNLSPYTGTGRYSGSKFTPSSHCSSAETHYRPPVSRLLFPVEPANPNDSNQTKGTDSMELTGDSPPLDLIARPLPPRRAKSVISPRNSNQSNSYNSPLIKKSWFDSIFTRRTSPDRFAAGKPTNMENDLISSTNSIMNNNNNIDNHNSNHNNELFSALSELTIMNEIRTILKRHGVEFSTRKGYQFDCRFYPAAASPSASGRNSPLSMEIHRSKKRQSRRIVPRNRIRRHSLTEVPEDGQFNNKSQQQQQQRTIGDKEPAKAQTHRSNEVEPDSSVGIANSLRNLFDPIAQVFASIPIPSVMKNNASASVSPPPTSTRVRLIVEVLQSSSSALRIVKFHHRSGDSVAARKLQEIIKSKLHLQEKIILTPIMQAARLEMKNENIINIINQSELNLNLENIPMDNQSNSCSISDSIGDNNNNPSSFSPIISSSVADSCDDFNCIASRFPSASI